MRCRGSGERRQAPICSGASDMAAAHPRGRGSSHGKQHSARHRWDRQSGAARRGATGGARSRRPRCLPIRWDSIRLDRSADMGRRARRCPGSLRSAVGCLAFAHSGAGARGRRGRCSPGGVAVRARCRYAGVLRGRLRRWPIPPRRGGGAARVRPVLDGAAAELVHAELLRRGIPRRCALGSARVADRRRKGGLRRRRRYRRGRCGGTDRRRA